MSIAEPPGSVLPTHLDLPHTDDKPVENMFQPEQAALLTCSLRPHLNRLHPDGNYVIGADCGIYWEHKKEPLDGCKAPDWYYVPNVPNSLEGEYRRSYVMWNERANPLLVVEFVSGNGEERDDTPETGKFWVYEQGIKAAYYAIHDHKRGILEIFDLVRGRYQPMTPDCNGRFRIPPMELDLGIREGVYHDGPVANWLRAWDLDGTLIPTPEETAEQERRRADQERKRADAFAARLRELGIDPSAS